jgi:hypothetical protein
MVGLIIVLGLAGAAYESAASAADLRAYPPPGQMVDVGGYRLHIHCTGTGSPRELNYGTDSTAFIDYRGTAARAGR